VAAIERGFQKAEIEQAAYQVTQQIDDGSRVVVGVNKFVSDTGEHYEPLKVDPTIEEEQARRLAKLRAARDDVTVRKALSVLKKISENNNENVLYPIADALRAGATLGETCDALREVWGEYRPN
jgi:methylmalonyl-CoA mutase N-terminal domain/subunit